MLFRVLGPLEVRHVDGRAADVPAGVARRVLSALLVRPNTWVGVDSLAEAVWPDRDVASPADVLWECVHRLRRLTPLYDGTSARIDSQRGKHRLNIGEGELDSVVFEQLVDDGRAVLDADPHVAARCFRAAAGLWRGTPFTQLRTYHSRFEAARLARLRWEALDELVDALELLGEVADAVVLLQSLLVEEPTRERTWLRLVEVLTRADRPVEAEAAFRKAVRVAGTALSPA
ncbi:AfsR/SARP family transcriptional regulator [Umezawaea tangerina]|uniref:DNA-binding SARP family transcriptional activator n=1 Tax=Umezawaea tangerina TaxID=84725 RepID=A0A2T0TGK1_9PSEU|nr:BTAD domain-containing putative transcriptional regulator [Umezawaea tangerina]PRY44748.1 DNA-binding SARP family transcriptional activator [Umezawaea tangerina]